MAEIAQFETQPYPARPHWTGDFHQLEAALFSDAGGPDVQAQDFAQAHEPDRSPTARRSPITDRYVCVQLPAMPTLQIDLSVLEE